MRRRVAVAAVLPLVAFAVLVAPRIADAHAHLTRSAPASGDTVRAPLRVVHLWFSEAVQPAFSKISLAPASGAPVALTHLRAGADGATELDADVAEALAPGRYTVRWSALARDGHPSSGTFPIVIADTTPARTDTAARIPAASDTGTPVSGAQGGAEEQGFSVDSPLYDAVRWLTYAAMLTLIGVVTFVAVIVPGAIRRHELDASAAEDSDVSARRLGVIVAWSLVPIALLRLLAQVVVLEGSATLLDVSVARLLLHTSWGIAWLVQLGASIALALLLGASRPRPNRGPWMLLAAVVLAATPAFSGHAIASERATALAVAADIVHVLAAAGWLGTLLVLAIVGLRVAMRRPDPERGRIAAALVHRFSPWALGCAALLIGSGIITTWLRIPSLHAFNTTDYGHWLFRKLVLLVIVLALGAYHERRARHRLNGQGSVSTLARSAAVELLFAALILVATSVLVATPPPESATDVATAVSAARES